MNFVPRARTTVVALSAAAAVALVGCASTPAADLREGDCVNVRGDGPNASVARVACDSPHSAEVFFVATLDEPASDAADAVEVAAEEACLFMFWDFAGEHYYESSLEARWLVPSADAWDQGERTAVCLVQSPEGDVTGSLRGR